MTEETELSVRDDKTSSLRSSDEDSNSENSENEQELWNPRFQDLWDFYETIGELHLVCMLADAETIIFEEATRATKWKVAMDEKIKIIEKN
jgi:hypothetical protein